MGILWSKHGLESVSYTHLDVYKRQDVTQNIIAKFCALYEGPYRVMKEIGGATYLLQEDGNKVVWGIFNTRQLKPYHSDCLEKWSIALYKRKMLYWNLYKYL